MLLAVLLLQHDLPGMDPSLKGREKGASSLEPCIFYMPLWGEDSAFTSGLSQRTGQQYHLTACLVASFPAGCALPQLRWWFQTSACSYTE